MEEGEGRRFYVLRLGEGKQSEMGGGRLCLCSPREGAALYINLIREILLLVTRSSPA